MRAIFRGFTAINRRVSKIAAAATRLQKNKKPNPMSLVSAVRSKITSAIDKTKMPAHENTRAAMTPAVFERLMKNQMPMGTPAAMTRTEAAKTAS